MQGLPADKAMSGSVEPSRCACELLAYLPSRGKPLADAVFGGDTSHLIQPAPEHFARAPTWIREAPKLGKPLNPEVTSYRTLRPHLLQNPMVPGLTIVGKKSFWKSAPSCDVEPTSCRTVNPKPLKP